MKNVTDPQLIYAGIYRLAVIVALTSVMVIGGLDGTKPAFANNKYAAIVMEANTGRVLFSRHADKRLHPASLTKVMTLLLTFEALESGNLSKNERIYISRRASKMVPSKLGLPHGSTIRVEDAIYALVTKSANDIAVALAEHIGGTEWGFSRLMNAKAKQIGMQRTTFQNASGLYHRYQKSTARDMAILSRYVIMNYPGYYRYFSTASFRYRGRHYRNHNRLMRWYKGMDGLKTGYISAAGFNLAASAVRQNNRLIGVVYGGRSTRTRDRHMARILDSSFARLSQIRMANAEIPKPPEKPGFRKAALVASAGHSSVQGNPIPPQKPGDVAFSEKSSFKLARFEEGEHNEGRTYPNNEKIPAEHFEMLARVLGSDGFNEVIGQGDYDPTVLSRIETGLLAVSAHLGDDRLAFEEQDTAVNDDILTMGKRVFSSFFKSDGGDKNPGLNSSMAKTAHIINGKPFPPSLPDHRLWDKASHNSWSVQVGAFNDREQTQKVLNSTLSILGLDNETTRAMVIPLRSGNQIIYRARLTQLDRNQALNICRQISDCMPIAP